MDRRFFLRTCQKSVPERAGPSLDIDKVADGNYWLALDAKELGLVDIIETSDEYLSQQSGANRRILKISSKSKRANLLERVLDAIR